MLPNQYIFKAAKRLLDEHGEKAAIFAIDQACNITQYQDDMVAHQVLLRVREMLQSIAKTGPEGNERLH